MSILDALFGQQNNGQQAQVPGAMQQQPGFMSQLLDPAVALPMAGALLGNQGNSANFGNALSAAGPAMAQRRELQAQTAQKNKTLEYLRQNSPDLAAMVDAGMPMNEAWGAFVQQRKAQAPEYKVVGDNIFNTADQSWISAPGGGDDYSQRQRAAEQYGLTPDDPRYQSFLLTGKMPREDAQPLTATDKKAILEADEMVQVTDTALPLLDRALELNDQVYSGPLAGTRGYISGTFGSDAGQATMEYDNLVQQQALATLKATFGAAPTEGERKILLEIAGSSSQPPEVRKGILERAKQAVARRQQFYRERAEEMRGGSFYKPGGGVTGQGGGNRTQSGVSWSVEP
nr:hypothetical protein RAR13_11865 [Aminobacter aminovorans]